MSLFDAGDEVAQVLIDDRSGRVTESWTGPQVAWSMARGYDGAFGKDAASLWIWIPLCVLFVLPFVDPRRPLRLLHLDLLVLVGFSASLAFFNHADIELSVPLVVPLLVYLLVRMLVVAGRPREARPIRLLVPTVWLAVALLFLVGFRVGLNIADSNVIDVGYSGVIGADRIADGERLYGEFPADNERGDTYGPAAYAAYVPFEQAFTWDGGWNDLPAAHAAAIAFDLLTILALFLLGRRVRGPTLGVALAYAWAAFPFTLYVSNSNANDGLVALLIVVAWLLLDRPAARGVVAALAGLTKFAPLGLAPLLAVHPGLGDPDRRLRRLALFGVAFALTVAALMAPIVLDGQLATFIDRTLAFQSDRGSPFSIWGQAADLGDLQAAVKVAAIGLAIAVAFVPWRRDAATAAALGAAVLLAQQLALTHWFYLYIVWFFPLVMLALLGRGPIEARRRRRRRRRSAGDTPGVPSPIREPASAPA